MGGVLRPRCRAALQGPIRPSGDHLVSTFGLCPHRPGEEAVLDERLVGYQESLGFVVLADVVDPKK